MGCITNMSEMKWDMWVLGNKMGKPSCDETTYGPGAATSGVALRLHEATGPVWAAWAFVMERYCGYIKRSAVRSRKHPQASIDNRILETAQLEIAKMRYGLTKTLSLKPKRGHTSKETFPHCKPPICYRPLMVAHNIQ